MDSFPINDEFYKLELIFKLTTDTLGSFKILCLIDLCLKDDRSSFNHLSHLRKAKDEFTLNAIKVSFTMFSSHSKSVTKMPTIWPLTGPLSGLCLLSGGRIGLLSKRGLGWGGVCSP